MGKITIKCSNPACALSKNGMILDDSVPAPQKCFLCGSEMAVENEKHWLAAAAEDDALWMEGVEENCPSVIAYEYRQLRKYCREQKAYAVLMSLKDNFEVLFKLETLLAFAWARKLDSEEFERTTAALLTSPNLSLGAWIELSNRLLQGVKKHNQALPEVLPLADLRTLYEKLHIVNWRNSVIGHGSMQMEEDQEFREDLLEKIRALKKIFEKTGEKLEQQKLFCGDLLLTGADRARGLDPDLPDLEGTVEFRTADVSFSADPFIVIRKHEKRGKGVYFFDNQKAPSLTLLQAYAEGSRVSEEIGFFSRLRSMLEQGNIHLDARADDVYLSEKESRELDLLQMSHKFVRPRHLSEWLGGCLEKHEKGVFLLMMGRGMGKSVFSEQLNRLNRGPLEISADVDVRTYHFSRMQEALSDDFETQTEWMWSRSFDGETDWSRAPRIRDLKKEAEGSSAQALCDFLKEVRRYSAGRRSRGKILMVLDGLDEIVNENVWEYIPTGEQPAQGVYILLTSRDPGEEDLPEAVRNRLKKLQPQETLRIGKDSAGNDAFLKEYIRTTKIKSLDGEHTRALLDLADHKVLQLGLYCRLLENGMFWESLPDAEHVVGAYLGRMEERLGETEAIFVREVLAILCTLGSLEPLKIRDIGSMAAEGGVTLRLAGVLRDLAPFLKAERTEEGNRFTIVNSDIAEELARQLPETEGTVRSLVKTAMAFLKSGYPLGEDWAEPLTAHVTELAQKWLPEKTEAMGEASIPVLVNYVRMHEKHKKLVHERARNIEYWRQLYLLFAEKKGAEDPETLNVLGNLSGVLFELGRYREALDLAQEVYETRKRVLGTEHPDTLNALNNLTSILSNVRSHEEVLPLRQEVYETSKRVLGLEHPDTLIALGNLAYTLSCTGKTEEALPLEQKVYETRKRVLGAEHLFTLSALSNLAGTLSRLGRGEEALSLEKEIYETSKRVLGAEHLFTLKALSNLSTAFTKSGRKEEALLLDQEVYETRRRVLGPEHLDTLKALNYLSAALSELGRDEEALPLARELYEISRRVLGAEHPDTLVALTNLSVILSNLGRDEEALPLRREVYEARERVLGPEHPYTLRSLRDFAGILSDLGSDEEALSLITQAYVISKRALGEDHPDTQIMKKTLDRILGKVN